MRKKFTNGERADLLEGISYIVERINELEGYGLSFPKPYPMPFKAGVNDKAEFFRIVMDNQRRIMEELIKYNSSTKFSEYIHMNRYFLAGKILELFYLDTWKRRDIA